MKRVSFVLAPLAVVVLTLAGRPSWGFAAAAGLLLGMGNMLLADRLVASGVPFLATSGLRLVVLTLSAFATLLLFKIPVAIAFVVGLAVAQFALSMAAVLETTRQ